MFQIINHNEKLVCHIHHWECCLVVRERYLVVFAYWAIISVSPVLDLTS